MKVEQYKDGDFNDEITGLAVAQEREACVKIAENFFGCECGERIEQGLPHYLKCKKPIGEEIADGIRRERKNDN